MLIVSPLKDWHARAVASSFDELEYPYTLASLEGFPADHFGSAQIGADESLLTIDGSDIPVEGVCWLRRFGVAKFDCSYDLVDKQFLDGEAQAFLNGVALWFERYGKSVNPWSASRSAENKFFQLSVAREVGFKIPETLISNDPGRIRNFYSGCNARMVFKQMASPLAQGGLGAVLPTTALTDDDLSNGDALAAGPGLYQRALSKRWEVRVAVFGAKCLAMRFAPKTNTRRIDWRVYLSECNAEEFELSDSLACSCRRIVEELGLYYATIDLAVMEDSEIIFLEINPGGQFLFIEKMVPSLPVLQSFVSYLINLESGESVAADIRLSDITKQIAHD